MSELTSTPYLSVNFGEDGGTLSWESHEEILQWINSQITNWTWLSQQNLHHIDQAFRFVLDGLNSVRNSLNQVLTYSNNPDQAKNYLNSAKSQLETLFTANSFLLPNSTLRDYIFSMRDAGNPREAGYISAYLLKRDLNNAPLTELIPAILKIELFKRGDKDRLKIESANLKKLVGQITTALTEQKELQINQKNEFVTFNNNLTKQADDRAKEFNDSQQERSDNWEKRLNKTQEDLNKLTETYDQYMALAAPVKYWEDKRERHRDFAIGTFLSLCLFLLIFGYELSAQISGNNPFIVLNKPIEHKSMESVSISPIVDFFVQSKIGAYILLVTLAFWFIRLLVRIFLSNIHLENDAAERVTMAKTYLSLIRDGAFDKKEHLGTILAALFRPTGDGIVKDEGLPPNAMELFTRLGGK